MEEAETEMWVNACLPPKETHIDPPSHRPTWTAQTSAVHFSQELFKVLHGSKERVNVPEIFHIITEVFHRRAVERTDPHRLDVQVLEVVQLLLNSCQTRDKTVMNWGLCHNDKPEDRDDYYWCCQQLTSVFWYLEKTNPSTHRLVYVFLTCPN